MTKDEMHQALSDELARFRSWSYPALAEAVETTRECGHLQIEERVAADQTPYCIEVDVFWDDRSNRDIRVCGSLYAEPQKNFLGVVYWPHCTDSFIMGPDGRFVGEAA